MSRMIKSIYLAKRRPNLSHDQFVLRWRAHGALVMSQSFFRNHIRLYVQAEVVHSLSPADEAPTHDAVAYLVQPRQALSDGELTELQRMEEDEYETFSGPILPVLLQVEQCVLVDGSPGGVTAFLFFLSKERAGFVAGHYGQAKGANRVIINTRLDTGIPGMSADLPYGAVVEVSAATLTGLRSVLDADGALWQEADLATITRECVMWDRL